MNPEIVPLPPTLAVLPRVRRRVFLRPDTVAQRVCERWGVTFEAVAGREPGGQVRAARHDLVRALRVNTAMSLAEIGQFLGGRDHSTVHHLLKGDR